MPNEQQPPGVDSVRLRCDGKPVAVQMVVTAPGGLRSVTEMGEHHVRSVVVTQSRGRLNVAIELA